MVEKSNFSKTIKGLYSQSFVTVVMGILGLLSFSIMSRLLTKTEFGYYATIISVVMIFRSLAEAGIGSSIVQHKDNSVDFVNTAYSLSLIVGGIATFVVITFSRFFSDVIADRSIQIPLILISLTLVPYSLNSVYSSLLLKDLHFLKIGIFQIVAFLVSNVIAIIMAVMDYGLLSIVIGNILYILFQNIIFRFFSPIKPFFSISKQCTLDILNFGGWLTASRLIGAIYSQIDKILMAKLLSIADLGNFYRTRGFIEDINGRLGGVFDTTLFPILSRIQDDKNAIQRAYKKSVDLGSIFFSMLFLLFFFNARLIILCFLGDKWLDQITLFRILTLSMLFYFLTRFADCFIRSLAYVKFGFYIQLLSCCLLMLSVFYAVSYGALGVAVAVVAVNLLSSIIKAKYICSKIGISFFSLCKYSLRGVAYAIPLVIMGIIFIINYDESNTQSIIFLCCFIAVSIVLFICCPKIIGETYANQIYPHLKFMISKICRSL